MRAQFITAEEVQQVLDVSRSKSYQIIRDLNKELKSMGYHTIDRENENDCSRIICWRRWGTVAFLCNK